MMLVRILKDVAAVGIEIAKESVKLVVDTLMPPGDGETPARPAEAESRETPAGAGPESTTPPATSPDAPVDAVEEQGEAPEPAQGVAEKAETPAAPPGEEAPKRKSRATPRKKTKGKAGGGRKEAAHQVIYEIIAASEDGIDTATLIEKTGFTPKKVHNNVYKLRKAGKVENIKKGRYRAL